MIQSMKELPCDEILAELPLIRELLFVIRGRDDSKEMDDCVEKFCEAFRKVRICLISSSIIS